MNQTKCPRCHGPASMIDKAPPGEVGDVVKCDRENQCLREHTAAEELEQAHTAVADSAHEFVKAVGNVKGAHAGGPSEIRIPNYLYMELRDSVRERKGAGQKLIDAQTKAKMEPK